MDIIIFIASCLGSLFVLNLVIMAHELGHYSIAFYYGLIAEEVSIGFGRVMYQTKDKFHTTWTLRLWPIGGCVDFSGQHPERQNALFASLSFYKQSAILFAGVATNILCAFLILTGCFTAGYSQKKLILSGTIAYSSAAESGLEQGDTLQALDGHKLENWELTQLMLMAQQFDGSQFKLTVEREGKLVDLDVDPSTWPLFDQDSSILDAFGIMPIFDPFTLTVADVVIDSPADTAGLCQGDIILAVDGEPVESNRELLEAIRNHTGPQLTITAQREGEKVDILITPEHKGVFHKRSYIGVRFSPSVPYDTIYHFQSYDLVTSMYLALITIYYYFLTSMLALYYLCTGQLSLSMLAGPVFILAQTQQFFYYQMFVGILRWIAAINICLAFVNLLPLPVLDGGQWLILAIERMLGQPLPDHVRFWLFAISYSALLGLLVSITILDLQKLLA